MANGPHRITNGPFDPELYKSEHEVQDAELKVENENSVDLGGAPSSHRNSLHTEMSLFFPRLYYRALQVVKHRRKRKRRWIINLCIPSTKLDFNPSHRPTAHLLDFCVTYVHIRFNVTPVYWSAPPVSHPTGLKDSRKCHWTANWGHRSRRINKYCLSTHARPQREARENVTDYPQLCPLYTY